jgi:hypothetical protein
VSPKLLARSFLLALVAIAGTVRANGAFPDSQSIILPPDQPHRIMLSTNFGVIISDDDGATWHWICEQAVGPQANRYQMGPAPNDWLLAVNAAGMSTSRDGACTWSKATGGFETQSVSDAFPDPVDPMKVYLIAPQAGDGGAGSALFVSSDGGLTFNAPPIYLPAAGDQLTGVEAARSSPMDLYVTVYASQPTVRPLILHSSNGGTSFTTYDQGAVTTSPLYLAAVDATNPALLFLRATNNNGDSLGISANGGMTLSQPLTLTTPMTCFLKRADGTLLVGSRDGASYRSKDGGTSFQPWPNAPHLRALAERSGVLYAAGSNMTDGFALASTTDEGVTWTPLLKFNQIKGPAACVAQLCAGPWATLMATPGLGFNSFSTPDMSGGGADLAQPMNPPAGGCGCDLGTAGSTGASLVLLALVLVFVAARRRSS